MKYISPKYIAALSMVFLLAAQNASALAQDAPLHQLDKLLAGADTEI